MSGVIGYRQILLNMKDDERTIYNAAAKDAPGVKVQGSL
jgi:hypothetical protein